MHSWHIGMHFINYGDPNFLSGGSCNLSEAWTNGHISKDDAKDGDALRSEETTNGDIHALQAKRFQNPEQWYYILLTWVICLPHTPISELIVRLTHPLHVWFLLHWDWIWGLEEDGGLTCFPLSQKDSLQIIWSHLKSLEIMQKTTLQETPTCAWERLRKVSWWNWWLYVNGIPSDFWWCSPALHRQIIQGFNAFHRFHGFHGYPWSLWISMESEDSRDSMDNQEIHGCQ